MRRLAVVFPVALAPSLALVFFLATNRIAEPQAASESAATADQELGQGIALGDAIEAGNLTARMEVLEAALKHRIPNGKP